MNVPKDQGLFLTVVVVVGVFASLMLWVFLPVYHKGESEEGAESAVEVDKAALRWVATPEKLIGESEQIIRKAEAVIIQLDEEEKKKSTEKPDQAKKEKVP
jgi:regulatory protein YycH of two-component signal transduction system YycFG